MSNEQPEKKIDKLFKAVIEDPDEIITLTDDQKSKLITAWKSAPHNSPPKLKDLVETAFPGSGFDGRSKQAKAIKDFLATYNVFPETNVIKIVGKHELTVAEKDFIQSNYDLDQDNKMEIAQMLFPDKKITPLSKEFKAIYTFIKELHFSAPKEGQSVDNGDFTPPRTYTECLRLTNKYTHDVINPQDASEREKQGINVLIKYLHSPRFVHMINTYRKTMNRELFLSEFIRATYDKPDLTNDELNLYLNLCSDYVMASQQKSEIELLNQRLTEIIDDPDGKITTSLAEMISAKTREYNDCLKRQEQLINKLNGSRAVRLKHQASANASIRSLVEYWREEKGRKKMIHIANLKEKAKLETVNNFNSMESIKVEIFGAMEEDFL